MKHVKLVTSNRYVYEEHIYVAGKAYTVKDNVAKHLLAQTTEKGIPFFIAVDSHEATQTEGESKAAKSGSEPTVDV